MDINKFYRYSRITVHAIRNAAHLQLSIQKLKENRDGLPEDPMCIGKSINTANVSFTAVRAGLWGCQSNQAF